MSERFEAGSVWAPGRFSVIVATVQQVVKHPTDPQFDLIAYTWQPVDQGVPLLDTVRRSVANAKWEKMEPKWEVGKHYSWGTTNILVKYVDEDGNAFIKYDGKRDLFDGLTAAERENYEEVQ